MKRGGDGKDFLPLAQRKATLHDGQDAGEMLLDIEARIGELAEKETRQEPIHKGPGSFPPGKVPKTD
jgi:hypothetical protein